MNLSLAKNIDSCSNLNLLGIYTLDKVSIGDNDYHNIKINISKIADPLYTDDSEYETIHTYTLEGTTEYIKNNEIFKIKVLLCTDFKSKNESIKKSDISILTDFLFNNDSFSISIVSSKIIKFEDKYDALGIDFQNLDEVLLQQDLFNPDGTLKDLSLQSAKMKRFNEVDLKGFQRVAEPPVKKNKVNESR